MEAPTPSNLEKRILELLNERLLSVSQIAKELKINRAVAGGYLEALKNQGKLEFYRVGRSNVYIVSGRMKK
ncbi:MAG: helix-turn-helix domain-containing protein [Candidatus Aenigmarchaeota archaeon]|nr:helix-turn-helix domain-containing protein [Candidatus Aenigmarchaeota archaeon]